MKKLTVIEFARMGGKARAQKLSKEQLSAIGRKGGRPRLPEALPTADRSLNRAPARLDTNPQAN